TTAFNLAIERPLEWTGIGFGDPLIGYPGSGVNFGRQRFKLSDVSPWLHQSHLHLVVLGPEDTVLRVFQVPVGPEPSASHYDDPSGARQLLALRSGRLHGDTKTTVEIALGHLNLDINPFARLRHLSELGASTRR
ncbi:MAG TPA: hypothetical protein PK095_21290, partial [Myxococcota bacterium]|nr:hypothetical protein [Myxococcota bacterium]